MAGTLAQLCSPRQSVFDPNVRDTVYSVDDLATIDAGAFFDENFVTAGMKQLLSEAFSRLEGRSPNSSGSFLLSQSMGGGKTHNLVALGLLAKYPSQRQRVMSSFYDPGPLGQVKVLTFSGRKTNTPFGIWGDLAEQMGRRQLFDAFYAPLTPPGQDDWVSLLKGDPVLIMLDELPPYFQAARAKEIGATTLDVITTTAIANLLVAVASGSLPNVCAVLTDLSGASYTLGSESIGSALKDLENEANRSVQRIDPVRLNSDEFYSILRARLFEKLPSTDQIADVASAYQSALDDARKMSLTDASPDQLRANVVASYPFHPGLRDLYARFRENQGFQQTRALIRLMRLVVAGLWTTGGASQRHLIAAHDLDLHDTQILNEIRQVNRTLDNAIAHDVASDGGSSVSEQIDAGGRREAQDAATLIFMSSLSTAVNPTLGLTRADVAAYLAAPGRDLGGATKAIDRLQQDAWYIHATHTGTLLFKNVENINAKLQDYARGASVEERERLLRTRLADMFKPKVGNVYQRVEALPALDQVTDVPDRTILVIVRPQNQGEIEKFFASRQFKNRVCFLTAREAEYQPVLTRLARLRAIDAIIDEFKQQGLREADPQFKEAMEIKTKEESNVHAACREAFHTILYPSKNDLTTLELDPKYVANTYEGEKQISEALYEAYKFRPDAGVDTGLQKTLEDKLWPANSKQAKWSEITSRAAQDPAWIWHHPRALDDLKEALIKREHWKEIANGFIDRGPFEKPKTSADVRVVKRDEETGEVTIRITPRYANQVKIAEDLTGGGWTRVIDGSGGWEVTTSSLSLTLLPEDSTGEHATGDPILWRNEIVLKHRFYQDGDRRRCELRAIPGGAIRYTTDGTNPATSGLTYTEPFVVPDDTRLVLALAAADGVSATATFDVPQSGQVGVQIDPKKPAVWQRRFKRDATAETFDLLATLAKFNAWPGDIQLTGLRDDQFWDITTDAKSFKEPDRISKIATDMMELFPGRNVTLTVGTLQFAHGQDLIHLVAALRTELKDGEVRQDV